MTVDGPPKRWSAARVFLAGLGYGFVGGGLGGLMLGAAQMLVWLWDVTAVRGGNLIVTAMVAPLFFVVGLAGGLIFGLAVGPVLATACAAGYLSSRDRPGRWSRKQSWTWLGAGIWLAILAGATVTILLRPRFLKF